MEKSNLTRTWGIAAIIIAAVVILAGLGLWITIPAKAQQNPPCCPAVTIQWQPQSILESVVSARIIEDNKAILNGLQALAKNAQLSPEEMTTYVGNTYLRHPRLLTKEGWVEGWENVLPKLKTIIAQGSHPAIQSVSALIIYQAYANAPTPDKDIDARIQVRMTFSASPGDQYHRGRTAPLSSVRVGAGDLSLISTKEEPADKDQEIDRQGHDNNNVDGAIDPPDQRKALTRPAGVDLGENEEQHERQKSGQPRSHGPAIIASMPVTHN